MDGIFAFCILWLQHNWTVCNIIEKKKKRKSFFWFACVWWFRCAAILPFKLKCNFAIDKIMASIQFVRDEKSVLVSNAFFSFRLPMRIKFSNCFSFFGFRCMLCVCVCVCVQVLWYFMCVGQMKAIAMSMRKCPTTNVNIHREKNEEMNRALTVKWIHN